MILQLFILSLAGSLSQAQTLTEVSKPMALQMTLTSHRTKYFIATHMSNDSNSMIQGESIYLDPRFATLRFMDGERARVELLKPIFLTLFDAQTGEYIGEKILKSFVIKTSPQQIQALQQVARADYIVVDELSDKEIKEFVVASRQNNYDEYIKSYLEWHYPPRLSALLGLKFDLEIDQLGSREGVYIPKIYMMSELKIRIPWSKHQTLDAEVIDPLEKLKSAYSAKDRILKEYLLGLEKMSLRKMQLEANGWLPGLYVRNRKGPLDSQVLENEQRIVVLPSALLCNRIFTK